MIIIIMLIIAVLTLMMIMITWEVVRKNVTISMVIPTYSQHKFNRLCASLN
jgi:hypothetical protein